MFFPTDDLRIRSTKVVLPPVFLEEELPATERASSTVFQARNEIVNILKGSDPRLMVVVGPCSIHDTKAAREYAGLLKSAIAEFSKELRIVMRVYFEKPRTTLGWKGLINDPHLDGIVPHQRRVEAGATPAAGSRGDGRSRRDRVPRHDFTAICRLAGELGSDWRAHDGEPSASAALVRAFVPGRLQERNLGQRANCD